ncbi:P-loop NTPase fold protein [Flavobacterium sp. 2]|uniref:KAP family P-loop NTPase fold protein n=1 Tax=Flavobacterium sp. 2 TaxID=308053 RepID=UPI000C17B73E|nr:P-loop NTPase fold protein [Flavobacterium sp. 2]PIF60030.1 putative KAP-like P-loop ATPase [Flavobacterium sp. 2]
MWSDNESLKDYIDYSHLVKAVTSIIDNDDLLPCSIGIYGDWGSGKSSLMRMIETKYEEQDDILVIKFNGWLFEGYEDAKTVLMGRIVDEIISKRKFSDKALKYAAKLLKRIDWIKVAGSTAKYGLSYLTLGPIGVAGVSAADAISKLKESDYEKYIKERQEKEEKDDDETLRSNIQEFHKNFENLIDETKITKIIVFIDDLDRCSPDTVIGTLEAIKLFLFTKKTAFIIGADERLIKYSVRRRFPEVPGDNLEVGRDYLEKLIQYPIRIPPLSAIELTTYINLLFSKLYCPSESFESAREKIINAKKTKGFGFVFDQSNLNDFFMETGEEFNDAIALCSQIVPVLSVGLNGNPRQAKRFLNTLLIRINMAEAKGIQLKKRVLAKLMLLEYFKPETFAQFHDLQANNNGKLDMLKVLEESIDDRIKTEASELTPDLKLLSEDSWIVDWITSEPKISNENLQSYFYFSREKLATTALNLQRMTPLAQDVLQKLLGDSKSIRLNAIKEVKSISLGEATSLFEVLIQKVRQEEDLSVENSPLKLIFDVSREQPELKSQLITFLNAFPENKLPMTTATLAESVLKHSHSEALSILLKKWALSGSKTLKVAAKQKLK